MGILNSIKKIFKGGAEPKAIPTPEEANASAERYYIASIEEDRAQKDRFFRMDPHSPIAERMDFAGLAYYPPDPAYRYALPLHPATEPERLIFQTSTGDEQPYDRIGTIEFTVAGQLASLAIYRSPQHGGLFLPFRDATSGTETYGAGRYLEPHDLGGGDLLVDFNLSYSPFCAYSDAYSCPLPPFENHLTTIAIRAGEKADYVQNSETT